MKKLLILLLLAATTAFIPAPRKPAKEKWVVLKGCTLKIAGSTNVNRFRCEVKDYTNPDTLQLYSNDQDKDHAIPISGNLTLPVFSFDCSNNMMTSDLRKTLKANEFPTLQISFLSLSKYPDLQPAQEQIDGAVCIILAGVAKTFIVNYHISMDEQRIIHLTGNQSIRFSDFNLDPPRRMGGTVKAKDKLEVEFRINFRAL